MDTNEVALQLTLALINQGALEPDITQNHRDRQNHLAELAVTLYKSVKDEINNVSDN